MTKTRTKPVPAGGGLPGMNLTGYVEQQGDLRAVFDRVHSYFFENPGVLDPLHKRSHRTDIHRFQAKGRLHAQNHHR